MDALMDMTRVVPADVPSHAISDYKNTLQGNPHSELPLWVWFRLRLRELRNLKGTMVRTKFEKLKKFETFISCTKSNQINIKKYHYDT